MEQIGKVGKIFSSFDNDLFEQADIDIISEKIEKNIPVLFADKNYMDIDDKLSDLSKKLISLLNEDEKKLFKDYIFISSELASYQNCLAYYLGIQFGINMGKLE